MLNHDVVGESLPESRPHIHTAASTHKQDFIQSVRHFQGGDIAVIFILMHHNLFLSQYYISWKKSFLRKEGAVETE
jgi:hypothetical protein